jgi:hypothetical protein
VAVYREQDKKDYLKYYHKEVAAGRKPLAFGRWLGGSNSKKTTSKPAAKKTPNYGTVRTGATERGLDVAGVSEKDMPSDLKRNKRK